MYRETIQKVGVHIASICSVLIVGKKGTRKSLNAVALAQMTEMNKISDMNSFTKKFCLLFSSRINITHLDEFINNNYCTEHVFTDSDYLSLSKYYLDSIDAMDLFDLVVAFESYKNKTFGVLLAEYVEIYYYLNIRQNHMLCNTTINSVNTGVNSLMIKESLFQMYRPNSLAHEKYLTEVEDEKGIMDNSRTKAQMDKESRKQNDDGKDVYEMIARHGSKGTNTKISVIQASEDVTAFMRRLFDRVVELFSPMDIYLFSLERKILQFFFNFIDRKEFKRQRKKLRKVKRLVFYYRRVKVKRFINKAEKLYLKYSDYHIKNNNYKRLNRYFIKWIIYLGKYFYCIQGTYMHSKVETLGNHDESKVSYDSFPMTVVYPADITFERYDQFAWYDIFNERNKSATIPLCQLEPFESNVMNRKEHLNMNYTAITRIYDEIDKQISRSKAHHVGSRKEVKSILVKDF